MRPEDRKPSKRVFPLLQNLDLDSVTFAQLQSTGDPITLEDMNVQELEDLLLCQFARLAVKSEWTGLLESGGGTFNAVLPQSVGTATRYQVAMATPFGVSGVSTNQTFTDFDDPRAYPFVAPESGDVSEIGILIDTATTSADALVGIYSTSSAGKPDALLGFADIEFSSTGEVYQTSITGTITLEAGVNYFFVVGADAAPSGGQLKGIENEGAFGVGYSVTSYQTCYKHEESTTALPDPFVATHTRQTARVLVSLKVS
jgi:hypothetical protein